MLNYTKPISKEERHQRNFSNFDEHSQQLINKITEQINTILYSKSMDEISFIDFSNSFGTIGLANLTEKQRRIIGFVIESFRIGGYKFSYYDGLKYKVFA